MRARVLSAAMRNARYLTIQQASERYGPSLAAWRRWIWKGLLGDAVCRFGRSIRLDVSVLEKRLRKTGQVLERP